MAMGVTCPQCAARFEVAADPAAAPRPAPRPRLPFPWLSVLIVLFGLLFFLLVLSGGFNIWLILGADGRTRRDDAMRAMEQQAQAQKAATQQAREREIRAQLKLEALQRQNEDMRRELGILREQQKP